MTARWRGGWDPERGEEFVLGCDYHPKTNGLGKVQRAIVDYLATSPAEFKCRGCGHPEYDSRRYHDVCVAHQADENYSAEILQLWHGPPWAIRLDCITRAVYDTEEPTAAQTRVIQRGVRRLEQVGLADCQHRTARYTERAYTDCQGRAATMPQAVSALFVALRWDCEHLRMQDALADEWGRSIEKRVDEMVKQMFGRPAACEVTP